LGVLYDIRILNVEMNVFNGHVFHFILHTKKQSFCVCRAAMILERSCFFTSAMVMKIFAMNVKRRGTGIQSAH